MKIDLYLNSQLIEIDKDIDFVLNKQFTDLTDLTSIIVDYSKTIKVPMTAHNNEVFNYAYKLERQVVLNDEIITYDPTRRIPMTMNFNGSTVMDGYAILNSINLKDKYYEINLYGQLGKIFYSMKEKPLKDYTKTNNGFWAGINMNNKVISDSVFNDRSTYNSWSSQDWTDFWGFAPQMMGKTDLFDRSTYEVNNPATEDERIKNFVDVINTARGITYSDMYVGDGFDINGYQEVRTYMCRPYVYADRLIQLVQQEINNGDYDGYTMILDSDWFNEDNPYYKDLCYFPGNESIVDSGESTNGLVTWSNLENNMYFPTSFLPSTTSVELEGYTYSTNGTLITISNSTQGEPVTATLALNCDGVVIRDRVTGVGDTTGFNQNGKWAFYNLPDSSYYIPIRYIGIYDENDQLINKLYLCDDTIHSVKEDSGFLYYSYSVYNIGGVWNILRRLNSKNIVPNTTTWVNGSSSNNYCEVTQQYNFGNIVLPKNSFRFKIGCDVIDFNYPGGRVVRSNINYSDYHTLCPFKNDSYKNGIWNSSGSTFSLYYRPIQTMNVTSNNYRSGSIWTILDVLGNDFNPFTWMIDYAKRFRLFFDIDYNDKTITLKSGYFNTVSYKKVDVDYGKDVKIEPIVDKYKRIDYGYEGGDSKKAVKYYKNYGVQYGDMTIETQINLNNETLHLTPNDDDGVFIPVDLSCLNYENLRSNNPIRYSNPLFTNHIINTLNKDGEMEYYPFFAFRWSNTVGPYWLTDDTPNQRNTGKYCYLDRNSGWDTEQMTTEDGIPVYYLHLMLYMPQFDNYIGKVVHLRNTPFRGTRSVAVTEGTRSIPEGGNPVIDYEVIDEFEPEEQVSYDYEDPVTGETKSVSINPSNVQEVGGSESSNDEQAYLFWVTFGVPKEVYNGYTPSNIDNYSIYNRWQNYLNEIFNVQNKKVTCYVRMTYPEFINFKFNQLFVIDNNTFLVNKIIDFNPNSSSPTKVELIQIDDVTNLK